MRRHRALRHQHEDDEDGTDRVEHEFDREDRHPDARRRRRRRRAGSRRAGSAASAPSHAAPAPRSPASASAASCAARTTIRRPSIPHRSRQCRRRWSCAAPTPPAPASPPQRSRRSRRAPAPARLGLRPWNTRDAFQTMPQATKPTAFSASESISPSQRAGERPERDRRRAEQIGGSPPFQRRDVFLLAEKQQHGSEHRRDHGGDEIKRRGIKRHGVLPGPSFTHIRRGRRAIAPCQRRKLGEPRWKSVCARLASFQEKLASIRLQIGNRNKKGARGRLSKFVCRFRSKF